MRSILLQWTSLENQTPFHQDSYGQPESKCRILDINYIDFENVYNEEEDTFREIYQYFTISGWLYEELSKIGGCVAEFKGLYIWGKTDFGQSMDMNHELKTIAKNVIERS